MQLSEKLRTENIFFHVLEELCLNSIWAAVLGSNKLARLTWLLIPITWSTQKNWGLKIVLSRVENWISIPLLESDTYGQESDTCYTNENFDST